MFMTPCPFADSSGRHWTWSQKAGAHRAALASGEDYVIPASVCSLVKAFNSASKIWIKY